MPPATRPRRARGKVVVHVATRKGAWLFSSDGSRRQWRCDGPHFLGQIIHHVVRDPRDTAILLAATSTGHLGPTLNISADGGKTWREAKQPPAYPKVPEGEKGRSVNHTFWLTPGHASRPGEWFAGTSPHGLFKSTDGGDTWEGCPGLNDDPQYREWMGGPQDGTPDGPKLHSVIVDSRDPNHMYVGMSSGGVHESLDGGKSWKPLIEGLSVVENFDPTQVWLHDPHCVRQSPSNPDRLYQQNHCGIYRLDRPARRWQRIGENMPKTIGDIGFPMVVHPHDDDVAWVFPMDGSSVWPRIAIGGKPAVYMTRNGGKTWRRQDKSFPNKQAWWTVKRQAMGADSCDKVGLYLGTTSGELWASADEGAHWRCIARHLPEIYAVEAANI